MVARGKKSKKPSVASSLEPPEGVFYVDRNLGRIAVPSALRDAGFTVEIHDYHLPPDAPDEAWIALCGQRHWIAITKDKRIRHRTHEIAAIKLHKAKVIVLRAKDVTGQQQGEILAQHGRRILAFAAVTKAPFVAGIDRSGTIKQYDI